MSNPSTVTNTAAASGAKALPGGAKGIALIITATILVIGGMAGCGLQLVPRPVAPTLRVVQRHATQLFFASASPKTVQVACADSETLLSGGFAAGPLSRVVYSGIATGPGGNMNTWRVVAYTGDEELSAFATCVNAAIPTTWEYRGGVDRSCPSGQLTGGGFGIRSTISGHEWGSTWSTRSYPADIGTWTIFVYRDLNTPSSELNYVQMETGAICAKEGIDKPELVSASFSVPRDTSGDGVAACPKGKSVLSGGYLTDDNSTSKSLAAPVFALLDAPGRAADPSPSPTAQWLLTTRNSETETSRIYSGSLYFPSPSARQMTVVALCARITAAAINLSPSPAPTEATATAAPPTATPIATVAPATTPTPTQAPVTPQPPSVSIQQPTSSMALKRGCDQQFQGTALTVPGHQPITDPQATQWTLRNTQTDATYPLGNGASGQFTIPLAPDGQSYVVEFKATDTANGLSATATVPVSVRSCIA